MAEKTSTGVKIIAGIFAASTVGLLISTIVLANSNKTLRDDKFKLQSEVDPITNKTEVETNVPSINAPKITTIFQETNNICKDKAVKLPEIDCIHVDHDKGNVTTVAAGPQAGANVTVGFSGELDSTATPNMKAFWESAVCPVNVHWHLGTEHYSVGQYDEKGDGPDGNAPAPGRRLAAGKKERGGFRCHHYKKDDEKFTKEFEWKHCIGMKVGETYEVHWPHSGLGACSTIHQYQTPFYDGVFCTWKGGKSAFLDWFTNVSTQPNGKTNKDTLPDLVGVQGQVFTIVNDEKYFYPDLMRGWVKNEEAGMATDIHYYIGSTTGTKRNNTKCSSYSPITWQVDRKCHMISASSFDKLCYDMKMQQDDMTDDLHAHGSRVLVKKEFVYKQKTPEENQPSSGRKLHSHDHAHDHGDHDHDHDHEHQQWF